MALINGNGTDTTMLVSPTYGMGMGMPYAYGGGNGLFGSGDSWLGILFLIALCNGGFGGFGGFGNGMLGFDFPWLLNSQNNVSNNVNDGFRDAQLHDSVTSVRDGISALATQLCNCCGDMQLNMSNGFNSINNSIFGAQSALSQQMNANEVASLNRSFAEQTANAQGFNGVQAGLADVRYTVATENCQDRYEAAQNTRDIIDSQTRGTQAILDKLCALELDGVKSQLAQAQRENVGLQNQLNMANLATSQTAQTSDVINGIYNRLSTCPVGTTPVYGSTPIFTCPSNNCNGNF